MTQNGKIFIIKNTILNLLAKEEMSIGLSLYIIKDIQQQLTEVYNDIVKKQLSQQNKEEQQQQIEMIDSEMVPVEWIPEKEEQEDNEDQAD